MKRIAFLFPGQGSQKVGMGQDVYQALEEARIVFETAEKVSGLPVTKLCFDGPMDELTQTVNLQPAITAVNLALLTAIEKAGIKPVVTAGHSLGEYSALCAAKVLEPVDTFKLVFERGRLMHREASANKGAMAAVIGLDIEQVNELVTRASENGIVSVANHNSPQQIVITGQPEAVKQAGKLASGAGARAIPLKVSGAWHSALIGGAEAEFTALLETITFNKPANPVIQNYSAVAESNPATIRNAMAKQLCNPVRWYESMHHMDAFNIDIYVEIGPGKVLTGLLKKCLPQIDKTAVFNVSDMKSLDKFLEAVG